MLRLLVKMKNQVRRRIHLKIIAICIVFSLTVWSFIPPQISTVEEDSLQHFPTISFLETGYSLENVHLTPRQACAIESAALTQMDAEVNLFFVNHDRFEKLQNTPIVEALLEYKNVKFSALDIEKLSKGSPLENFINSKKLSKSKFILEHTSDVFRYLVLWKYGGLYLDMDIILQRSIHEFPNNFACYEGKNAINGAILRFEGTLGKNFVEDMMNDLKRNFDPDEFGTNGPSIVTKLFQRRCDEYSIDDILKMRNCGGLNLLDSYYCYAVPWSEYRKLYDPKFTDEVMRRTNESVVTHYWNYMTKLNPIQLEKNSSAAYILRARQFCPKVFKATEKYF